MKTVDFDGRKFLVKFKTDPVEFQELLKLVKAFPKGDRTWNPNKMVWEIAAKKSYVSIFLQKGFVFQGQAQTLLSDAKMIETPAPKKEVSLASDPALYGLHPYQVQGVEFLENNQGFGYIGDEMGLGKTIQAIGWLKLNPTARPAVVLTTASMKLKWKREIEKWAPEEKVEVLFGELPKKLSAATIYIINYHILGFEDPEDVKREKEAKAMANAMGIKYLAKKPKVTGWCDALAEVRIQALVADEAHRLSNQDAIWTRSFIHLYKHSKYKRGFLPLSGTPVRKRPKSLFTVLNLGWPKIFPDRWQFQMRYCGPKNNGFGWVFDGASHLDELHEKLKPIMIRRLKSEVLPQLPAKQHIVIPLEQDPTKASHYSDAHADFLSYLYAHEKDTPQTAAMLADLKKLAYISRRNAGIQWIKDYLSENEEDNGKIVLFGWHKLVIQDLMEAFGKIAVKVDGSVKAEDRQLAEDRFQKDDSIRVFVGNFEAAGEGLTLTRANSVAFVEFADTPGQMNQAADRIHRIGQEADSVFAYYFMAPDTIDADLMAELERANRVVVNILDGKKEAEFFDGENVELNKRIIAKYRSKGK